MTTRVSSREGGIGVEKRDVANGKVGGRQKMTFSKVVILYMLGGIVGTVWETLLNIVRGRGFVYCNGSIFTPFNFVYGVGAIVIVMGLSNFEKWWQVYLAGAIGGGVVEYLLSFLEETILGTRSWNYSGKLLNINGRTTLPYMAFWGLLCLAVIFVVYKPLDIWLDTLPERPLTVFASVMAVIICIDFVFTVGTLLRYTGRHAGKKAVTFVGRAIDRVFDDAFMGVRFPAMKF